MGRPYGDDLRRQFLSAYDASGESLEELAERVLVGAGWAKKISAQRNRTGQAERGEDWRWCYVDEVYL